MLLLVVVVLVLVVPLLLLLLLLLLPLLLLVTTSRTAMTTMMVTMMVMMMTAKGSLLSSAAVPQSDGSSKLAKSLAPLHGKCEQNRLGFVVVAQQDLRGFEVVELGTGHFAEYWRSSGKSTGCSGVLWVSGTGCSRVKTLEQTFGLSTISRHVASGALVLVFARRLRSSLNRKCYIVRVCSNAC